MKKFTSVVLGPTLLFAGLVVQPDPSPSVEASPTGPTVDEHNEVIQQFCVRCHGKLIKKADMSLLDFDVATAESNPELSEKIIRKLRAGLMPPPGQTRPEKDVLWGIAGALEERLDTAAAEHPTPGRRTFQRLNRAEYSRSVHDLLGMEVDVSRFLPPDTMSGGFDNIADVQNLSPTLLEGYLRAAVEVSRLAVGDPDATPADTSYRVPRTASQLRHVEGAPIGTRGGLSRMHIFPADAEYVFKIQFHTEPTGRFLGVTAPANELEISIDGERVALLKVDRFMSEGDPQGASMQTDPVLIKAGPHRLSAAFINQTEGPVEDLLAQIHHTLADTQIGTYYGVTTLPHMRLFVVSGPYKVTGVSETSIRRRIFTERPISAEGELSSATAIISKIATKAYRRPLTDEDVQGLLTFYKTGAQQKGFEFGIRLALQAILASPHFVFRFEQPNPEAVAGEIYEIGDMDLASRLSFFLWASPPDEELLEIAGRGDRTSRQIRGLSDLEVLDEQVDRMLRDPRAESLATRFASQWLRLQDLEKVHPDALVYPMYDHTLAEAMERETELLFHYLVQEDRSVLELWTADYTFVNERLAQHYGVENIVGPEFQRVTVTDEKRYGVLGHGSFLTSTSQANRTSPVQRGKWVMEVFLGNPPPAPPPNVPEFEETGAVDEGRLLTVRERMAMHRANPACMSCHLVIDPIGVALEEFDVTGIWRRRDGGAPVDSTSELYDGTVLNGPVGLREALLARPDTLIRTFTENLMSYGLGRRLEYYDMPAVREIARDAAANGNKMTSFIKGVVHSAAFRMSQAEGVTRR